MSGRKGAISRAAIPPEILARLNRGEEETASLSEWLAVDLATLTRHALPQAGLDGEPLARELETVREQGVMDRLRVMGRGIAELTRLEGASFDALSHHLSDVVRCAAAMAAESVPDLDLAERIWRARPFAADGNMGVRECAWFGIRRFLEPELDRALELLQPWVLDEDYRVRRCAVEATRPRGVWCAHLGALKREPHRALPLLEPCRADPHRYVQDSVANWLNDASKSQPEWVKAVCARWQAESQAPATAYIVRRALRTLRKS